MSTTLPLKSCAGPRENANLVEETPLWKADDLRHLQYLGALVIHEYACCALDKQLRA
jgi:hypothetical protein